MWFKASVERRISNAVTATLALFPHFAPYRISGSLSRPRRPKMSKSHKAKEKFSGAMSRRGFFGRAAVAGGAVLLGPSFPGKAWAQEEGLSGLCDFPVPIPHINTPPPG